MDRYFELVDDSIKEAILNHHQEAVDKVKLASEFSQKYGLGVPMWSRFGAFDHYLGGFRRTYTEPNPDALTRPDKHGCTKPKRSGAGFDKEMSAEYVKLVKAVKLSEDPISELLGWSSRTFFPTRPGCRLNFTFKKFFFIMPERVSELKGCVELTNIEYIARIKELDALSDAEQA